MTATKNAHVSVPSQLLPGVVNYVEVSSLLAKKALDEVAAHRQMQKKAADMRPALLSHLMALGLISNEHKQAAEMMLGSHAETMSLLKMAGQRIEAVTKELETVKAASALKTARENGTGANPGANGLHEKQAYDSLRDPVIGNTNHDLVRESDKVFLALIGK